MCKLFNLYVQLILGALSANPLSVGHLCASGVGRQGLSRYTWSWRDHQGSQIDKKHNNIWKNKVHHRCVLSQTTRWSSATQEKVKKKQKLPRKNFEQLNLRKVHGCLPSLQGRCCAKGKALSAVNASKDEEKNFKLTFEGCEYSLCLNGSMLPWIFQKWNLDLMFKMIGCERSDCIDQGQSERPVCRLVSHRIQGKIFTSWFCCCFFGTIWCFNNLKLGWHQLPTTYSCAWGRSCKGSKVKYSKF